MDAKPTILYVEDDPHSRRLMTMLLKGRMQLPHVTILEDSADFMARVNALEPPPDLILLDIHVEPHDGFAMIEMLRQSPRLGHKPIVALTASVMNEEVNRLQTAGFNGCLAKPIDINQFPHMIARILDGETVWGIMS